ncbi:hypothetical protein [uncultured Piscinibacter sp.]|uniref:hypothetical protein n=1 Tax=uncultured Piscinibacter sp. TaxID=1131835 RepID=UPI00262D9E6E|nr:hypothetical protein [uncultured Piscinibacter sp.]
MTIHSRAPLPRRALSAALTAVALASASLGASAAPGAHGPNGEHLDAPAAAVAPSALPRVEARSEAFELVAELRAGAMTILVDRYETNEPVLGATLEVESGPLKAAAAFRAEQGDYAVTDAALLQALAVPGEHALVFTLIAGKDSDLLDATLVTTKPAAPSRDGEHGLDNGDGSSPRLAPAAWIGAGLAALGLLGGLAWWLGRRRHGTTTWGGL